MGFIGFYKWNVQGVSLGLEVAGFRSQAIVHLIWLSSSIAQDRERQLQPSGSSKAECMPQAQKS